MGERVLVVGGGYAGVMVITGRLGAWLKEQVCRYTIWSLRSEGRGFLSYRWLKLRGRGAELRAIEGPGILA